ncbi:unnamed protein product [Ilex paraguariensis]|uniref:Ubiquitin-like protease family profile domain-containing protein n=1 Tax=Ilex paraguariensis TaxID=185542 RepID=A0ABC8UKW5_9AQUA
MEGGERKRKKLDLDWGKLLSDHIDEDEEPPTVMVVTNTGAAAEKLKSAAMDDEQQQNGFNHMNDRELNDVLERNIQNLKSVGDRLPDKGQKLRVSIKRLEEEIERRQHQRAEKDNEGCEKGRQSRIPSLVCAHDGSKQGDLSSLPSSRSAFASYLRIKKDENMDSRTVDAFEKEFAYVKPCEHRKVGHNRQYSSRGRPKNRFSLIKKPSQCPSSLSMGADKHHLSNGDQKGMGSSTCSSRVFQENLSGCLSKKRNASQVQPSNELRLRNGHSVVLVDEEEPQLVGTTEQADRIDECMKETKIYYPSRDDPESVEIVYSDMDCLAPEAYLSSTIMNFYIRYLQQPTSPTNRTGCDYHCFNTYFYKKLKEAVMKKPSDNENTFEKFRRWWKGVNIFEKAYLLLPIHDNLHWSLVIICIPYKEEEAGPIVLHLDSLGLHSRKSIFENIKSFLREEWNYLNKEEALSGLPIADKIWKDLPHRINEKTIEVPQQRNEYDCGVFVLFYMERFLQEAPKRMKKNDLAMFGKHWFGPEEPSRLRGTIWSLLWEEFKNASDNIRGLNP